MEVSSSTGSLFLGSLTFSGLSTPVISSSLLLSLSQSSSFRFAPAVDGLRGVVEAKVFRWLRLKRLRLLGTRPPFDKRSRSLLVEVAVRRKPFGPSSTVSQARQRNVTLFLLLLSLCRRYSRTSSAKSLRSLLFLCNHNTQFHEKNCIGKKQI